MIKAKGRVILNPEYSTLGDIKELAKFMDTAYYSTKTVWWTINSANLYRLPDCGLPCDPLKAVLFQADAVKFIKSAEASPGSYGIHRLDAFVAAYHGNIIVEETGFPTSLFGWDQVNKLLDQGYLEV